MILPLPKRAFKLTIFVKRVSNNGICPNTLDLTLDDFVIDWLISRTPQYISFWEFLA